MRQLQDGQPHQEVPSLFWICLAIVLSRFPACARKDTPATGKKPCSVWNLYQVHAAETTNNDDKAVEPVHFAEEENEDAGRGGFEANNNAVNDFVER